MNGLLAPGGTATTRVPRAEGDTVWSCLELRAIQPWAVGSRAQKTLARVRPSRNLGDNYHHFHFPVKASTVKFKTWGGLPVKIQDAGHFEFQRKNKYCVVYVPNISWHIHLFKKPFAVDEFQI